MVLTVNTPQLSTTPITVLFIDDNDEDLKYWCDLLKRCSSHHYTVLDASSAESGLELCRSNRIDCVVLDLDMPESGFYVLFNLIRDRTRPQIAVVILTHLLGPNLLEMAKHNGAQACLVKQATSAQDLENAIQNADLHDDLAQLLSVTRIKLSLAKQQPMQPPLAKIITDAEEMTIKAITYTRTLMSQLSPPDLSESGLPMALQWLSEQMQQHDLSVSVQVKTEMPTIPEEKALLLFQSIRELLFNCVKHAKTHEATITLEQVDGSLCIQISDQGAGFDLADASRKAHSPTSGFGLVSTRERMLSVGGRFELESSPGNGTRATLVLPLSDSSVESFIATQRSIIEEAKAQAIGMK